MAGRITRSIRISLPGGRTSAESVAAIVNTVFTKGLENGERVESIQTHFGEMGELLTMDVVVSSSIDSEVQLQAVRDMVDDRRR